MNLNLQGTGAPLCGLIVMRDHRGPFAFLIEECLILFSDLTIFLQNYLLVQRSKHFIQWRGDRVCNKTLNPLFLCQGASIKITYVRSEGGICLTPHCLIR